MSQGLRLVLVGPPGAGKGTQARLLTERLQLPHISSGDLFRQNLQQETPLGLRAAEYMNQGLLVPDEVTIDIFLDMVLSYNSDAGFILDGFPRNPNQAQALEEALERRSRGLDKALHIDVTEDELIKRLGERFHCRQCQAPQNVDSMASNSNTNSQHIPPCSACGGELYRRADDTPEAVRQRMQEYRTKTMPLLDFFQERGLLVEVSGTGSVEGVTQRVLAALGVDSRRVSKTSEQR